MTWIDNVNKTIAETQVPNVEIVNGIIYTYEKLAGKDPIKTPTKQDKKTKYTLVCKLWEMKHTEAATPEITILKAKSDKEIIERNKLPSGHEDKKKLTKHERFMNLANAVKQGEVQETGTMVKLWLSPAQAKVLHSCIGDRDVCAFSQIRSGESYQTKHTFNLVSE